MLRRIDPGLVERGMFVHGFEGRWLSHPFWRARFLVETDAQLARLRDGGVAVVIDEARGRPLADPAVPSDPPGRAGTRRPVCPSAPPRTAPVAPLAAPARGERHQMKRMLDRSERAMRVALNGIRAGQPIEAAALAGVVDDIMAALDRNPAMLLGLTRLKTKDNYTFVHSLSVAALMVNLAREIGLGHAEQREIGLGGLLHDVGKMTVADAVLGKRGPLDAPEMAEMREHPARGAALLSAAADMPAVVLDICLHHHEKLDGSGYPHGLAGAALSTAARVAAICDIYDAVTSERPYKGPWSPLTAVTEMDGWEGQLDRRLLFQFMKSLGVYPVGTLVRLRSNRLGIVGHADARGRARITAFYAIPERGLIPPVAVTLGPGSAADGVLTRERPEAWGLSDWDAMRARLLAGEPARAAA